MINKPILITGNSFQQAWKNVVIHLSKTGWEINNLVVHIIDPSIFDIGYHTQFCTFVSQNSLLGSKDVAYTIFPHQLYRYKKTGTKLFDAYNRHNGLYERLQKRPRSGWGTYFRRMTHYNGRNGIENQLQSVIDAINRRSYIYKASYTIIIQEAGHESIRPRGGPCLNYISLQLQVEESKNVLGMMSVYRNHDFLKRAYGNYWGLCNLVRFLSNETGFMTGPLTIVSSHAYIDELKRKVRDFVLVD